mgnify:CR=1 FL=1
MKRISRKKALEKLYESAGRIFYAEFIKKDGSLRRMTARLGVHKGVTGKGMRYDPLERGLLPVYDMDKADWRMINLNTLRRLSVDHERYLVA